MENRVVKEESIRNRKQNKMAGISPSVTVITVKK